MSYGESERGAKVNPVPTNKLIDAERPRPNIEAQLQELEHKLDYLGSRMNTLAGLLAPVLLPERQEPSCTATKDQPNYSPVANAVYSLFLRADRLGYVVNNLIERVDA